jgi:hypothetical protein
MMRAGQWMLGLMRERETKLYKNYMRLGTHSNNQATRYCPKSKRLKRSAYDHQPE